MFELVLVPAVSAPALIKGDNPVSEIDGVELAGRLYRHESGRLAIMDYCSQNIEQDQIRMNLRRRLAKALVNHLPARQRLVIIRRYFEGRTLDDIAQELHVTIPAVHRMHGVALKRLREVDDLREFLHNGSRQA